MLGIWPIGIWHIRYLAYRYLAYRYLAPQPGRHMWMAPTVKTDLISPFKMFQKQVNMGRGHFEMNMVVDVRGVGVIKMMMVDDMGGGGCRK